MTQDGEGRYLHDYSNRKSVWGGTVSTISTDSGARQAWVENQLFYFLAK